MELSKRACAMPASPIRKLIPYADEAKAKGKIVYHLNIGQPDIETPPAAWEAIRNYGEKVLAYGPSQGFLSVRESIRDYFKRIDIELTTDEISITDGGSEAIIFAYASITDPGDEILVFEPFYTNYNGFANMLGVTLVPITLHSAEEFALPPEEKILEKISPKTRAIQICSPNNPTGKILTKAEMDMLVGIAKEKNLFIVSDEVYREFAYGDEKPVSVLTYPEISDRAIVIDSISKRYSACGARVGCIVSHNADVMACSLKYGQARLCPPTLEQVGAEAAYRLDASYFDPVRDEYHRRRDTCVNALQKMDGVLCPCPGGAFYIIAKLPVDNSEDFIIYMLRDFDLDGETVMTAPAAGFYATPGMGNDEIRIAYVLEVPKLERSMHILETAIKAYNSR
ncbi:MAG: pyridoxal phosphate-dependent aminotransferase [Planctomycetota bacterium]|jgi:aspartate aminotransferase